MYTVVHVCTRLFILGTGVLACVHGCAFGTRVLACVQHRGAFPNGLCSCGAWRILLGQWLFVLIHKIVAIRNGVLTCARRGALPAVF